jgi:hypothetical protein
LYVCAYILIVVVVQVILDYFLSFVKHGFAVISKLLWHIVLAGFQGPMLATLLETKVMAKARVKARGRRAVIKRRRQRQANSRRGASANDKVQQEHAVNTKATKATGTDAQHARIDRKVVSGERRSALKAGSSSYSSSLAEPGSEVDNAGSDLDDAVRAQSEADQTNPNAPTEGQKEVALDDVEDFIDSKSGGESGEAEFDEQQVESEDSEKDLEFSQTYKQFMDALEETCKYDMPEQFAAYCKPMFDKGEKIVEYYLHDYDDEDICTYVQPQCTEYFQLTSR